MTNKERFIDLLRGTGREGVEELIAWYERTDFFEAPASSHFHGAAPGMLCKHSLNVYDQAMMFASIIEASGMAKFDRASITIASLNHDACKAEFYKKELKNRKTPDGRWEQYESYTIDEKFCFGGHGSKSVYLVQHFIDLKPEEAVAINCHMGPWDGNKDVGKAYAQFPLAWLIHVADEAATYFLEDK